MENLFAALVKLADQLTLLLKEITDGVHEDNEQAKRENV